MLDCPGLRIQEAKPFVASHGVLRRHVALHSPAHDAHSPTTLAILKQRISIPPTTTSLNRDLMQGHDGIYPSLPQPSLPPARTKNRPQQTAGKGNHVCRTANAHDKGFLFKLRNRLC